MHDQNHEANHEQIIDYLYRHDEKSALSKVIRFHIAKYGQRSCYLEEYSQNEKPKSKDGRNIQQIPGWILLSEVLELGNLFRPRLKGRDGIRC